MDKSRNLYEIIKKLDIPDSMRKNAKEKYENLAKELNASGIQVEIYPQGSFALGTVVRPFTKGKDVDYDLDFICQEIHNKNNVTPKYIKKCIEESLRKNGRKVDEDNTCWTIDYANIQENLGFKIDVVPAVEEDEQEKQKLFNSSVDPNYVQYAIAITKTEDKEIYKWDASNAKGYTNWFNDINEPFLKVALNERAKQYYSSIEKLPEIDKKSNLQRVIQILKRHRDIFFYRATKKDGEENKPSSSVITTIVAQICKGYNPNSSLYDLLKYVISELEIYSQLLEKEQSVFSYNNLNRIWIKKENKQWYISNPVNPYNNLAGDWDDETAEKFFKWIRILKQDLVVSVDYNDERYYIAMKNAFGDEFIDSNIKEFTFLKNSEKPVSTSNTKPWRNCE